MIIDTPAPPPLRPAQSDGWSDQKSPEDMNAWIGGAKKQKVFFPEETATPQQASGPVLSLQDAIAAAAHEQVPSANPLTAAAASILILLGRLQSGLVAMDAAPLSETFLNAIRRFETDAVSAGASEQDAQVAKYALCATADDIVQNIPGKNREIWLQNPLAAREFGGARDAGIGFYTELKKAVHNPAAKYDLLELMLTCISVGFKGQYRLEAGGDRALDRERSDAYAALRRVRARPDEDLSYRWMPVPLLGGRTGRRIPIWVLASVAGAFLFAVFLGLRTLLGAETATAEARFLNLHPIEPIVIAHNAVEPYVAPEYDASTQLERIRDGLADDIAAGILSVEEAGDFIVVNVNNLVLFASGQARVKAEFQVIGGAIARALQTEPGPVFVVGHTDSDQLSGRGRYKNNHDLSVARAQAVADVLIPHFEDGARIQVDGRGASAPLPGNTNATAEEKAKNRRVEIKIKREGLEE